MTRREAREQGFLLVFEALFKKNETPQEIMDLYEKCYDYEVDRYARRLFCEVAANTEKIDKYISHHSHGWNINRISKVSLSILRVSICELLLFPDIPPSVSINEAVELAKNFGGEDDASFVNGVLGGVSKHLNLSEKETSGQAVYDGNLYMTETFREIRQR